MIKTVIIPLTKPEAIDARLNELADEGWLPLAVGYLPASDGPGALLYTLGEVREDESQDPDTRGNGHEMPEGEVLPAVIAVT